MDSRALRTSYYRAEIIRVSYTVKQQYEGLFSALLGISEYILYFNVLRTRNSRNYTLMVACLFTVTEGHAYLIEFFALFLLNEYFVLVCHAHNLAQ